MFIGRLSSSPLMRSFATTRGAWEQLLLKQRRKRANRRLKSEKKKKEARERASESEHQAKMRELTREMLEHADEAAFRSSSDIPQHSPMARFLALAAPPVAR